MSTVVVSKARLLGVLVALDGDDVVELRAGLTGEEPKEHGLGTPMVYCGIVVSGCGEAASGCGEDVVGQADAAAPRNSGCGERARGEDKWAER